MWLKYFRLWALLHLKNKPDAWEEAPCCCCSFWLSWIGCASKSGWTVRYALLSEISKKSTSGVKNVLLKKMRLKILTKWKTVGDSFPALQSSVATLPTSHVGIGLRGEWPAGSLVMSNAGRTRLDLWLTYSTVGMSVCQSWSVGRHWHTILPPWPRWGRGTWQKIHHKAQQPHEASSPFHCSHQMILLAKIT